MNSKSKRIFLFSMLLLSGISSVQAKEPFRGGTYTEKSKNGLEHTHTFKNGHYVWKSKDEIYVKSTYLIIDNYIVITDKSGSRACLNETPDEQVETGIYTWESFDDIQVFNVIHDSCGGRQRGLLHLVLEN